MARLWGTGFEMGSLQCFEFLDGAEGTFFGATTVQARNGSYSFNSSSASKYGRQSLDGNPGEIFLRVGFWLCALPSSRAPMIGLLDPAGVAQLTLGFNISTARLELRRGDSTGAVIAEGSIIALDTWYCYEMHVVADPVSGAVELLLDGVSDLTFSGDSFDAAAIGFLRVGSPGSISFAQGYYDDIAINDTTGYHNNSWVGRGGFWPVVPAGVGTSSDFTPEPAIDDNWECVDDIPPDDDTSYVESDTENHEDLYTVTPLTPVVGTITAVHYWTRARMSEAGIGGLRRLIRHDGANYEGTDLAFDTTYRYVHNASHIFDQAPDDTGWDIAKVNALEIGQKVI